MTFAVHKYTLTPGECSAEIPVAWEALTAQFQRSMYGNGLALWAHVDVDSEVVTKRFLVIPTGAVTPSPVDIKYIATAQEPQSGTVWHVFQVHDNA